MGQLDALIVDVSSVDLRTFDEHQKQFKICTQKYHYRAYLIYCHAIRMCEQLLVHITSLSTFAEETNIFVQHVMSMTRTYCIV